MSVTAPAGFEAAGVAAGLKSTGKPDVAVVVNRGPRKVGAAVFTSNRAKANPIIWSQQAVADRVVEAVVLNSGGANCFTGSFGFQTTHQTAEKAAQYAAHVERLEQRMRVLERIATDKGVDLADQIESLRDEPALHRVADEELN